MRFLNFKFWALTSTEKVKLLIECMNPRPHLERSNNKELIWFCEKLYFKKYQATSFLPPAERMGIRNLDQKWCSQCLILSIYYAVHPSVLLLCCPIFMLIYEPLLHAPCTLLNLFKILRYTFSNNPFPIPIYIYLFFWTTTNFLPFKFNFHLPNTIKT